jgi:hypothetical protein
MLESDSISLGKVFIKVLPMLARMREGGDDAAVCFDANLHQRIRFKARSIFTQPAENAKRHSAGQTDHQ